MSCTCLCDLLRGLGVISGGEEDRHQEDASPQVQDEVPLEEPPAGGRVVTPAGGRVVTGSMVGPTKRQLLGASPDIMDVWTPDKKSRKDTKRNDEENVVINVDIPTPQQARRATGYATGNAAVGNTANKEVICVDTPTPQKKEYFTEQHAVGSSTATGYAAVGNTGGGSTPLNNSGFGQGGFGGLDQRDFCNNTEEGIKRIGVNDGYQQQIKDGDMKRVGGEVGDNIASAGDVEGDRKPAADPDFKSAAAATEENRGNVSSSRPQVAPTGVGAVILLVRVGDGDNTEEERAILFLPVTLQDYLRSSKTDEVSVQLISTGEVVEIPKRRTRLPAAAASGSTTAATASDSTTAALSNPGRAAAAASAARSTVATAATTASTSDEALARRWQSEEDEKSAKMLQKAETTASSTASTASTAAAASSAPAPAAVSSSATTQSTACPVHANASAAASSSLQASSAPSVSSAVNARARLKVPTGYRPVKPIYVEMLRRVLLADGSSTDKLRFLPGNPDERLPKFVPLGSVSQQQFEVAQQQAVDELGDLSPDLGLGIRDYFRDEIQGAKPGDYLNLGLLLCPATSGISAALKGTWPPNKDPLKSPTFDVAMSVKQAAEKLGINFVWINLRHPKCTCDGCVAITDDEAAKIAPLIQVLAKFYRAIGGGLRLLGAAGTSRGVEHVVKRLDPNMFAVFIPIANHLSLVTYYRPAGTRNTFGIRSADLSLCYFAWCRLSGVPRLFKFLVDHPRCVMICDDFSKYTDFDFGDRTTLPQGVASNSSTLARNFSIASAVASDRGRKVMSGQEPLPDNMCVEESSIVTTTSSFFLQQGEDFSLRAAIKNGRGASCCMLICDGSNCSLNGQPQLRAYGACHKTNTGECGRYRLVDNGDGQKIDAMIMGYCLEQNCNGRLPLQSAHRCGILGSTYRLQSMVPPASFGLNVRATKRAVMVEKFEHGFVVRQWTNDVTRAAADAYAAAEQEVRDGNIHSLGDWMLKGKTTSRSLINRQQFTARMRDIIIGDKGIENGSFTIDGSTYSGIPIVLPEGHPGLRAPPFNDGVWNKPSYRNNFPISAQEHNI